MTDFRENKQCCHFHPKQLVVGICARCLRDRLLLLESKQAHLPRTKDGIRSFRVSKRKSIIALPKVFALGSFIHLLEPHHRENKDRSEDEASIDSLEGKRLVQIRWVDHSFITMKFEDEGQASWNADSKSKSVESSARTALVEHSNPGGALRWRKRIGQLLQLGRWKRSNKASACHAGFRGKVEGVKGRRGWMRSLTRRTTSSG
ncbi:hypothetical protein MUK42_16226 [Musa troglodytarum]|uniref:Uncharacterized protein n=1 Tax=Musa troglodytarum TaxID=320322 RepID=A0A9E7H8U7_9LILI|nr:hypothetical protein MUK42_16226 [Musa troglodytarum]